MRVEVLFFDGCPSHERLRPRLRALLSDAGVEAEVLERRIESEQDAAAERFLGSPTVRIAGADIDPGAERRTDFGLKCRLYRTAAGLGGVPPEEWIMAAIERAKGG